MKKKLLKKREDYILISITSVNIIKLMITGVLKDMVNILTLQPVLLFDLIFLIL